MTAKILTDIKSNPTTFVVTDPHDPRIYNGSTIQKGHYEFLNSLLLKTGHLYGTYYRDDCSFWEEDVFVCPNCRHATLLGEDESESEEFYCKYCYTDWKVIDGRLYMEWTQFDGYGDEVDTVLI